MSVVVSFRIDRKIKRKMDELKHINWSEIVRRAIIETIRREETKNRKKDLTKVRRAALRSERLSRKVDGWSSVEEIRRWRERR
ncbi:MAG: hypothetical protein DRN78_05810 [Thermoproteota archaeon]|nr:MAG: hypothetical protein DRN78_05810 [Candidatus Korarchaeota archaeon]